MTGKKRDMKPEPIDPDDAPEWTDEMFEAAEFSVGGKVVRPARGVLGPEGVIWGDAAKPGKRAAP